ncbi:hypothetical protein CPB97_006156 [Podila verticillata]|nr:hypothetical protein CPB97_006156 [Podila verticillata]
MQSAIPGLSSNESGPSQVASGHLDVSSPIDSTVMSTSAESSSTSAPKHHKRKIEDVEDEKDEKVDKYWTGIGMNLFVPWMLDPETHEKLRNPHPISGCKQVNLFDELAKSVNEKHRFEGVDKWTSATVKSKVQYFKKKFDKARSIMTSTGEGNTGTEPLESKVKKVCPYYNELQAIYASNLSRNPVPPVQFGQIFGRSRSITPAVIRETSIQNLDESEIESIADDEPLHAIEVSHEDKQSKRRKKNPAPVDTYSDWLDEMLELARSSDTQLQLFKERETALIIKEQQFQDRLDRTEQQHRKMLEWRTLDAENSLQRRLHDFLDEKAEFKERKRQFEERQQQFEERQQQFEAEREKLIKDNVALQMKVEMQRRVSMPFAKK